MLTAERVRALVDYDPLTGVMTRRLKTSIAVKVGQLCGSDNGSGHLQLRLDSKMYQIHRVAWIHMTGAWPTGVIDHLNGKSGDNRWANLRDVSPSVNAQNLQRARADNATGLLGVSTAERGRFRASIHLNGRTRHLGRFATPQEAHAAYLVAKRALHPGNTL